MRETERERNNTYLNSAGERKYNACCLIGFKFKLTNYRRYFEYTKGNLNMDWMLDDIKKL